MMPREIMAALRDRERTVGCIADELVVAAEEPVNNHVPRVDRTSALCPDAPRRVALLALQPLRNPFVRVGPAHGIGRCSGELEERPSKARDEITWHPGDRWQERSNSIVRRVVWDPKATLLG